MAELIDVLAPAEQEGTKASVRAFLKAVGDVVALDDPLVELETDKVAMEVPAPAAGVLAEICVAAGVDAPPGMLLARIRVGAVEAVRTTPAPALVPAEAAPEMRLSPAVRRAVAEHGIDPQQIDASGRGGRLTRADIDAHVAALAAATDVPAPSVSLRSPPPPEGEELRSSPLGGGARRAEGALSARPAAPEAPRSRSVSHTPMRRRIAERMVESIATAPHVTAVFEADMGAVLAHRAANRAGFEAAGVPLTITAYLVMAAAHAMKAAPGVNSRWHADRLELFSDVNVGVGTALGDGGLIVPVIHRAQLLSLEGVARRLADVTTRARAGTLAAGDVAHGTFTISNHGVSGTLLAAPVIIVQPQSAILGVGKLEKRVVVRDVGGTDAIAVRPMCYVSLTIDHRALDGAQTNAWLTRFVEVLEGWG